MSMDQGPGHSGYSWGSPSAGDPYAGSPSAGDPYAGTPYAGSPSAGDPYATDPPAGEGFGSSVLAQGSGAPAGHASYSAGVPVPGPPGPYVQLPPSSSHAITGFILGLAGLVMCAGLTAPVGIVFSALGMRATSPEADPPRSGRGLAIAGLVTSLIGMIPFLLMVLYIGAIIVFAIVEAT
ncbi:DUF4190 domain-containing protein [Brachybacterium sp. GCM10030268]|uniref:DUF4190 domain-containing protein n=1 Tax=Brachybacterium sp. GCM10030268 TaxID=3273382 RepID=UPI0036091618